MATVLNPETGELRFVADPSGLVAEGWRVPTPEEAQKRAEEIDARSTGQQVQAQGERVVRGATLGAVRGFGTPEEIQTRADVSQREHPVLSFAADAAPMVGIGALAAATGGAAAVGLGAAEGGLGAGLVSLGAESAATGLVGAGQAAFQRNQYLGDDPGRDAENALIFGGINFGLGAASKALTGGFSRELAASRFASAEQVASGEAEKAGQVGLEDVAKTAEADAARQAPAAAVGGEEAGAAEAIATEGVEGEAPLPQDQVALTPGEKIGELSRQFNEATGLPRPAADIELGIDLGTEVPPGAPEVSAEPAGAAVAGERVGAPAAVEDGMDRALANASRSEAEDTLQEALGEKAVPVREASSIGRQRALYQNRAAILDVSGREMSQDLSAVVKDLPDVLERRSFPSVTSNVGDNLTSQRVVTDGVAENAATLAGQLRGEARARAAQLGESGLRYAEPGQKQLVLDLMDGARAARDASSGREMFEALHSLHSTLQDGNLSGPVSSFAGELRTALEDPAVWGKAGDMQKAFGDVVDGQLRPALDNFEQTVLGRAPKGAEALSEAGSWESQLRGMLESGDMGKARQATGLLDALDSVARVRTQYGEAAAGKQMAEGVAKLRRTMDLASEVSDATQRMQALGQLAGHVPLVGRAAREWVTGDLANAFRRLSGAVDRNVGRGVDDWIASSHARGSAGSLLGTIGKASKSAVMGTGESSAIGQVARRQGISMGLARFMGQDQSPQAAFSRARAALQNDEQFFKSMGDDYKSLQEQAPETYLMLSGRAATARQFLLQRMPANLSVSMINPNGYPPARDSIEDWSVYWNAVKDPMHVASNIRSASIRELQTLQAVYPRLYEAIQQKVIEKVGAARAAGIPLDDTLQMRLQILFPVDGVATPAFSKQAAQMGRDYQAQQAPQGQGRTAPSALARPGLVPGPVQGIAQSGATFGTSYP